MFTLELIFTQEVIGVISRWNIILIHCYTASVFAFIFFNNYIISTKSKVGVGRIFSNYFINISCFKISRD